jgi:hypothetical protein
MLARVGFSMKDRPLNYTSKFGKSTTGYLLLTGFSLSYLIKPYSFYAVYPSVMGKHRHCMPEEQKRIMACAIV